MRVREAMRPHFLAQITFSTQRSTFLAVLIGWRYFEIRSSAAMRRTTGAMPTL